MKLSTKTLLLESKTKQSDDETQQEVKFTNGWKGLRKSRVTDVIYFLAFIRHFRGWK